MKRQPTEWEKIFANAMTNNESIGNSTSESNNPVKKYARDPNRHSPKKACR